MYTTTPIINTHKSSSSFFSGAKYTIIMTVKDGESFQTIKSDGDKQYSLGNFDEAIQKYSTYIQRNSTAGNIDLALVYSNRCACYLQQGSFL